MSIQVRSSILEKMSRFVSRQPFVTMATVDRKGRPHVSPKSVLKVEAGSIYLVDHFIGKTYRNVKKNGNVSLSSFSIDKMVGFFVYGKAVCVEKGKVFDSLVRDLSRRQTKFAARRISENISKENKTKNLKLHLIQPLVIYKVKVKEVNKVDAEGSISRQLM